MNSEKQRYPIGQFVKPEPIDASHIAAWIKTIAEFPARLNDLVGNLKDAQLDWSYRPGGWTIRQLVHHCADSHMNSFVRLKLCLTEDRPTVKPYFEDRWAETPDAVHSKIAASIKILEGLHARWTDLLGRLNSEELKREFFHPEQGRAFAIDEIIGIYAWHSRHHLAHIKQALEIKGKFAS